MSLRRLVSVAAAFGLSAFVVPAFADALPPAAQDCKGNPQPGGTADIGDSCSLNDSADTPGTCQPTTCTVTGLCTDGGSGTCSSTIACVLCIAGNGDGGHVQPDADGGPILASSNGGSGCSASPGDPASGAGSLFVGIVMLAGLVIRARKEAPRA